MRQAEEMAHKKGRGGGPKTPEGKAVVRRNPIKHGVLAQTPVIPLVRVPWNDPAHLMKMLDAGVYGVICPMINTRAQAETLVRTCKYPPAGKRDVPGPAIPLSLGAPNQQDAEIRALRP